MKNLNEELKEWVEVYKNNNNFKGNNYPEVWIWEIKKFLIEDGHDKNEIDKQVEVFFANINNKCKKM